ncbi:MAG: NUDIX domain-containing protein [Patescibacteria group bacterium]|jgi:8-oxo-dGTP pyrophosphatase MutT (NUDIX family)
MKKALQNYIEQIKNNTTTDKEGYEKVMKRLEEGGPYFKSEGTSEHICAFFVPVHKPSGSVYLGYHKKADDWIPPGGHMEGKETPLKTVKREMEEELQHSLLNEKIEFFDTSYKFIGRPESGCTGHYDLWHIVYMKNLYNFPFDKREYHDAGWFFFNEGIEKIKKNPEFAAIVRKIQQHMLIG